MKIERHLGIISYLIEKEKTTATELASLFHVSTRTIMRDLDDLTLAGIPFYTNKGKNGGIFLMDIVNQQKPPLTIKEISSIETSLKSRYQVLEDDSTFQASLKLNKINTNSDFEIDLSLSKGNIELRTIVFQLLESIRKSEKIAFNYLNNQGEQSNKICEPYRVVFKDRSWYLDAYDQTKKRFSVFKIAKIATFEVIGTFTKKAFIPQIYDGGDWLDENKIIIIIYVNKLVIDKFIELLGTSSVKQLDDSWYEVAYPLHDNEWGYNTLLQYGKNVKIIAPNAFKENFLKYLNLIVKQYQ